VAHERGIGLSVLDAVCVDWRALDGRVTARIAIDPRRCAGAGDELDGDGGPQRRGRPWLDRRSR
jgi:hypothetical protein